MLSFFRGLSSVQTGQSRSARAGREPLLIDVKFELDEPFLTLTIA